VSKPAYLVVGEEFLVAQEVARLVDELVPAAMRDLNLERVDAAVGATEIAMRARTAPMFRGGKCVVVEGAEMLAERDAEAELKRARALWKQDRRREAARRLLALVAPAGWTTEELKPAPREKWPPGRWKKSVGVEPLLDDRGWIADLADFALSEGLKPPPEGTQELVAALEGGLPPGNALVLAATGFDRAHPLYKAIAKHGEVRGKQVERKGRGADALEISGLVKEVLGPLGKRLARDAEAALKDRLGDRMRLLASELEKLAAFAGDRDTIEARDVEALVGREREEEGWAVSEALGSSDAQRLLELFEEELRQVSNATSVALPFLGQLAGAARRGCADSERALAQGYRPGMSMREFERKVLPELDIGNRHPFAVYKGMERAASRRPDAWARALVACAETDIAIKTGADPRLAVERLVLQLCARRQAP
jgi:DNA polymerase-3 subunit delta